MSIEIQIMDGPPGFFCKINILLVMLAYVPGQTSIPNNKNLYNAFIIKFSSGRYLDNLNNKPTD